jgi:protein tyrosine phosphatase
MLEFAQRTVTLGVHGLRQEFAELKSFKPNGTHVAFTRNPQKNRYADVTCVDQTRVVLHYGQSPTAGDYIHANSITSVHPHTRFICAQGPLPSTVPDFWRMIWQEGATHVIMLCKVEEDGKAKCAQYWPQPNTVLTIGQLTVARGPTERNDDAFATTMLSVTETGTKRELAVRHHQWLEWKDRSVPKTLMGPFRLLSQLRSDHGATAIVHCSAGIGRTGTVVALELCTQRLYDGGQLIVSDIVKTLRQQRSHCVQTESQYLYLHRVLLAYIEAKFVVSASDIKTFAEAYDDFIRAN